MAKRIPYIPNRVIDTNGISDGASIFVYETGTTTPVTIYSDEALTTPLANPYTVAAGAAVPMFYHNESGNIRVRVVEDGGTVVSDDDPFEAPVTDIDLASTDAGKGADLVAGAGKAIATRTAMKALTTAADKARPLHLTEGRREGVFIWDSSDLSTEVAADTQEGIYIAPDSDTTGASGAWVRQYWGDLDTRAAGAAVDNSTDDAAAIQGALDIGTRALLPHGASRIGSAIDLGSAEGLIGLGPRSSEITNTASNDAVSAQGGAGTSKHFGINLAGLRIDTSDYAATTGAAISLKNQGIVRINGVETEGHQTAGVELEAVVGLRQFGVQHYRNNYAQSYTSPSSIEACTTCIDFGTNRAWMLAPFKNSGDTKQIVSFGGVCENFNKLVENSGSIAGFHFFGEWFEDYGTGRVVVAGDGSTSLATKTDSKIDVGGVCNPTFNGCYFSGDPEMVDAFNPRVEKAVVVPSGATAIFHMHDLVAPDQFELDASESLWGAAASAAGETSFGIASNLPIHGSWSTPDEKHYKSGTFDSVATANQAGIWSGAGAAAHNRIWSELGDNTFPGLSSRMYWPYTVNSPSRTTGIADPYGGTTAVQIDDGRYGSSNIPFATGGNCWVTVVVVFRAVTAGDELHFSMYHVNATSLPFNKTIELEIPDTEWRIATFTQYLPADASQEYRMRLGTTTGGSIIFGRYCCFEGARALPPIQRQQEITTPFVFRHGNVIMRGAAAPVSGQYHVGDKVELNAPTAGGTEGFICTTAGAPGTWKAYGSIAA